MYLIQGDPGSGKTTLALQFLIQGLREGQPGYYVTLSETKAELLKVAQSHGWSLNDLPMMELSSIEEILRPEAQTTIFHPSEADLNKVTQMLLTDIYRHKPVRVVFDSLSEFRLMAETPLRYRRQLLSLKQEFSRHHSTTLLLDDRMSKEVSVDPHIMSLSHGVIEMEQQSPDYGISRRRLRVIKMRGSKFHSGWHDYSILTGGLRVHPRLIAAEHHADFKREPASSGIHGLDSLLGGGLDRGTTTLIMGAAGTGKSSLALQYASAFAKRGERVLIYTFDEVLGIMLTRARALGLEIDSHIENGSIVAQQVDPAELSPGEFAVRVQRGVEGGAKLVVIDSLNGYLNAMPGERYLANQLHELSSYLNHKGVLSIIIMAQHGLVATTEAPVDLSYLADTVVLLKYFEAGGEIKKALAVIKKRSGSHEQLIREFRLDIDRGIRIGEPLKEFHGILGGAPNFRGNLKDVLS
jgi:circadian clock protein KaiC